VTSRGEAPKAQRAWQAETGRWSRVRENAGENRAKPTGAEDALWQEVRARRLKGAKFRRQHAIGRFLVDFYCAEARLVIEVDGGIHSSQQPEDRERESELAERGLTVIRFTNDEIMRHRPSVNSRIAAHLTPNPSPISERGTQSP
jgi:very-short-patch-repair endonuclease